MGIKNRATKAAAGAVSIAVATGGLTSSCDNGAVDPLPPPLSCDAVGDGQTLQAEASLTGGTDTVLVNIRHLGFFDWSVDSVGMVTGGTIRDLALPQLSSFYPSQLEFRIEFDTGSTSATFTVFAKASDSQTTCDMIRQFTVTTAGGIAAITQLRIDDLPLPTRLAASIVLLASEGRVATLEARTEYAGEKQVIWTVSDGSVTSHADHSATWTLPDKKGIYQAEVVVDYGPDGVAFDALAIEVL